MIDSRVIAEEGGWCYLLASHPIYKSFYGIPSPSSALQCVLGWMSVSFEFLSAIYDIHLKSSPFLELMYNE